MSSLVMRCPEVNTLFHLWINYICGERRLEHPAMWDVRVLALKPNCPFSCHILLQFHFRLLGICLSRSLFGWMHPQQLLLGVWLWFGDKSPQFQFYFSQKEKSSCDFDISFQIWQVWEGLLKRAGKFLIWVLFMRWSWVKWGPFPNLWCPRQSKTSFVGIYFSWQFLQYISLHSRWNFINCILSSATSLTKLLKLNLTQIHVIPWLFSPAPLFPVGLAGAKS